MWYAQVTQEPFKTTDDDGNAWTLGDLLVWLFGEAFLQKPGASEEEADARVLVHGISPPLSTPLQWMAEHMCHPDHFVHIIVTL